MNQFLNFLLATASLTVSVGCSQAQAPTQPAFQNKPLRLFLIGNSYSQNATRYLPQIVKSSGHELVLGRAEAPGRALGQHWEAVEAAEANPTDPKGLLYNGKSLRTLLSDGTWDIVTIQQSSVYSSDVDTYRPYAQKLRDFIKTIQPQAEVVMHQTWAYRADTPKFGFIHAAKGERTQSAQEMYEKSREAYHTIAGELGLRLIPNGDAFWTAGQDPKWGWKKDEKFDYANAKAPDLPNLTYALNAGPSWQDGKLSYDPNSHSSDAGMYLGGLMWYGFLFHESPENITFAPNEIPADFAAFLRKTAAQTLVANGVKFSPSLAPIKDLKPLPQTAATETPSLTTAQGAGADTSVRGGELSARNFGALDILRVRNSVNLVNARKAYLRFDLSALPNPVKGARSARLSLTSAPAEGSSPADKSWTFQVYGLKDGNAGESWSENSTNWENAPANDVKTTSTLTDEAVILGTFTLVGQGEVGKSVSFSSPELLKFLQSDTNGRATLIITRIEVGDAASDNVVHIFTSKENGKLSAPNLSVAF